MTPKTGRGSRRTVTEQIEPRVKQEVAGAARRGRTSSRTRDSPTGSRRLSENVLSAAQLSCGRDDAAAAEDLFHPSVISLKCLEWELIRSGLSANVVTFVLFNVLLSGSFLLSLRKQLR